MKFIAYVEDNGYYRYFPIEKEEELVSKMEERGKEFVNRMIERYKTYYGHNDNFKYSSSSEWQEVKFETRTKKIYQVNFWGTYEKPHPLKTILDVQTYFGDFQTKCVFNYWIVDFDEGVYINEKKEVWDEDDV